jgi:hypothetical protein
MAHFGKFLSAIGSDWLARMSGPLTVPFTVAAFWFPSTTARILFAILAIVAALLTCYRVWAKEYDRAETERQKNSGSHITGELGLGYLDVRNYHFTGDIKGWQTLDRGCYVTVYVVAVNHNDCGALFWSGNTTAEMRIGQYCFTGKGVHVAPGLTFKDSRLVPNSPIYDFFDGIRSHSPMQQGIPAVGFMAFLFEGFDRTLISEATSIQTAIRITVQDTLSKKHSIEGNLDLLIGSVCLQGELGIPSAS